MAPVVVRVIRKALGKVVGLAKRLFRRRPEPTVHDEVCTVTVQASPVEAVAVTPVEADVAPVTAAADSPQESTGVTVATGNTSSPSRSCIRREAVDLTRSVSRWCRAKGSRVLSVVRRAFVTLQQRLERFLFGRSRSASCASTTSGCDLPAGDLPTVPSIFPPGVPVEDICRAVLYDGGCFLRRYAALLRTQMAVHHLPAFLLEDVVEFQSRLEGGGDTSLYPGLYPTFPDALESLGMIFIFGEVYPGILGSPGIPVG